MTMSKAFHPATRLLLGPGPSNIEGRVLQAMGAPMIGYFDPTMPEVTGEISRLLRMVFGTNNAMTLPVSGTGTAGMEAAIINLLEPGDTALVAFNGYFGDRMAQIVERCGAVPVTLGAEWGRPILPEQVEGAFKQTSNVKLLGVVHAETSTGVLQPLDGLRAMADRYGAYLLVDAVTSLGGHPVEVDRHGVDVLLRDAEGVERSDGPLAHHPVGSSDGTDPEAAPKASEFLLGPRALRAVLDGESALSPHTADHIPLRASRGATNH
jgi:alanine-glyoxylate transaminase/serine-glyoxylate transaminase/serine-pyruvate transaminase